LLVSFAYVRLEFEAGWQTKRFPSIVGLGSRLSDSGLGDPCIMCLSHGGLEHLMTHGAILGMPLSHGGRRANLRPSLQASCLCLHTARHSNAPFINIQMHAS
jgi:hypothetical protein